MNFLDRLFGRRRDETGDLPEATARRYRQQNAARSSAGAGRDLTEDERAIERYRYLLRTAPPETIEEAHAEAFAQLTPEQRRMVLDGLSREVPERELAGAEGAADDPRALARLATRAEVRRPGTLERTFAGAGGPGAGFGGVGLGGLMAGSFLSSIAGVVVGTAIADAFFLDSGYDEGFSEGFAGGEEADAGTDAGAADQFDAGAPDAGDYGADIGGDFGADVGGDLGADIGGDFGTDFGGDFGGDF